MKNITYLLHIMENKATEYLASLPAIALVVASAVAAELDTATVRSAVEAVALAAVHW